MEIKLQDILEDKFDKLNWLDVSSGDLKTELNPDFIEKVAIELIDGIPVTFINECIMIFFDENLLIDF